MNIEKGIPAPESALKGRTKYPWPKMDIGDSVFFEGEPGGTQCNASKASIMYGKRTGKKFASRSIDGGVRIWRIE